MLSGSEIKLWSSWAPPFLVSSLTILAQHATEKIFMFVLWQYIAFQFHRQQDCIGNGAGEEIARQIADVALHVYHSARTWGKQLNDSQTRPNLQRVPMLARLGGNGSAEFSGGITAEGVDAVVYCTGYRYSYPFLERTGLISTGEQHLLGHILSLREEFSPACRSSWMSVT